MQIVKLLPLVFLAACFDAGNAPSCTIQCNSDSDCTEGLTCGPGGLCTDGSGNCIEPDTCMANEFIACVSDMARSCNATGDGTTDASCGVPGCNTTERRCNNCVPDAVACIAGEMLETCMPDGSATVVDACGVPGCNTTALRCNACIPSRIACGAGGTDVEQCMPDGSARTVIDTCAAGCVPENGSVAAHCRYLSPNWLPDICDTVATQADYTPNASATITTSLDTNCDAIVTQTGGGPICVVRAKTITIPSAVTLTHDGTRPIAYVADSLLDVRGTLDASANGTANGPGANKVNATAASSVRAGGGAGFGTAGAAGGSTTTGGGGAGGAATDPFTLAAFGGGARAADPNGMFSFGDPFGGGGGGAVMLVACRGEVRVSGTVDVNGGGGQGNYDTIAGSQIQYSAGAGGGGTGGYVVIQALTAATVDGGIWANGGGGGGGATGSDLSGGNGSDGNRSASPANGGMAVGGGQPGGAGGSQGNPPRVGTGAQVGGAAGGGGGAVGVLQMFTPMTITPSVTGTTSPGFVARKNSTVR